MAFGVTQWPESMFWQMTRPLSPQAVPPFKPQEKLVNKNTRREPIVLRETELGRKTISFGQIDLLESQQKLHIHPQQKTNMGRLFSFGAGTPFLLILKGNQK